MRIFGRTLTDYVSLELCPHPTPLHNCQLLIDMELNIAHINCNIWVMVVFTAYVMNWVFTSMTWQQALYVFWLNWIFI